MKPYQVFSICFLLRILSIFVVKTSYVPDEYWQSLEVAHKLAFGYGHLTWEWTQGIRSYLYPSLIAIFYKVLGFLQFDHVEILILLPRVLQSILTAFADYRFYNWCGKTKWSLFIIATSWFWFYTGSRTLINTVETALTIIALSYYPWANEQTCFLWFVGLACFIRPTAIIPWLPLCYFHIKNSKFSVWEILLKRYFLIGLVLATLTTAIDYFAHGSLIFTPWNFLQVNVLQDIGSFYGSHPWHWYFTVGLPTVLGIGTLPFIFATADTVRHRKMYTIRILLLLSILGTLAVFSALPHKEFRFVLPILPMCLYISADYLARWSRKASKLHIWVVTIVLLIGNAVPAIYLGFVHQKGTTEVMPILAKIAKEYKDEIGNKASILFLMPCHSTPYYSHIHANVSLRFLTCEPNLKNKDNYVDEADQFYKNPMYWLDSHIPIHPITEKPSHLVLFDSLQPNITEFLSTYNQIHIISHSDIASERVGKNVIVYERFDAENKKAAGAAKSQSKKIKQETPSVESSTPTDEIDGEL